MVMRSGERGSALLLALVIVLVVTMSVLLVAGFIHGRRNAFVIEERGIVTTGLADAAMAETLARLGEDRHYQGLVPTEMGAGTITSDVRSERQGYRTVVAVGTYKNWAAVIETEIDLRRNLPVVLRWDIRQGLASAIVPSGLNEAVKSTGYSSSSKASFLDWVPFSTSTTRAPH